MPNLATQTRQQLIGQSQGPLTMSDLLDLSRPTLVKGDFDLSDISNIVCLSTGPTTISLKNTRPGQYGSLIAGQGAGTARYTVPTGWTVTYAGATSTTSFPVCKFAGAKMNFVRTGPSSVDITGEFATSINAWHPTTEDDNCLFVMHAGYGHKYEPVANTTEATLRASDKALNWFPRWSSKNNARFSFDPTVDEDNLSFSATLESDAAFDQAYSYVGREVGGTSNYWNSTVYPQTGAWRFYLGVRQLATGLGPGQVFKCSNTALNGAFGSVLPGLSFINATYGYQLIHDKSAIAWGSKTGTMATHEHNTNALLINGVVTAAGNVTLYSGTTKITETSGASGAMVIDRFVLAPSGSLAMNFGGLAVLNGTATSLALEQDYFADLFI